MSSIWQLADQSVITLITRIYLTLYFIIRSCVIGVEITQEVEGWARSRFSSCCHFLLSLEAAHDPHNISVCRLLLSLKGGSQMHIRSPNTQTMTVSKSLHLTIYWPGPNPYMMLHHLLCTDLSNDQHWETALHSSTLNWTLLKRLVPRWYINGILSD